VPVLLRTVMEADAEHVASLLAELGYPSNEADIRNRLRHRLHSQTSCFLLAQSASEVIGFVSAELVPYFPNGSTICRVTALIVSINHRGRRVDDMRAFVRYSGFDPSAMIFSLCQSPGFSGYNAGS
jgi:hypothetical protein